MPCEFCNFDGQGWCAVCGGSPSPKDTPAPLPKFTLRLPPEHEPAKPPPDEYPHRLQTLVWAGVMVLILAVAAAGGWLVSWLVRAH